MSNLGSQVIGAVFRFLSAISAILTPARLSVRRIPVGKDTIRRIRR